MLEVGNLGIDLSRIATTAQEQAIGQLHDVGFMDSVYLLALLAAGVAKGKARNARRSLLGNDLQALDYTGHDFVLDS